MNIVDKKVNEVLELRNMDKDDLVRMIMSLRLKLDNRKIERIELINKINELKKEDE